MPAQPTSLLENIEQQPARMSLISIGASVAVSVLIFWGIVQAQKTKFSSSEPLFEDIRAVVIPSPPPPPKEEKAEEIPTPPQLLNLDSAETDTTTIQIAYSPTTIQSPVKPTAMPEFHFVLDEFRPSSRDLNARKNVYKKSEVDQAPVPIYKKIPKIDRYTMESIDIPRVAIMYIVNLDGSVSSVRLLHSASPEFDQIIMNAMKLWRFRPAVKDGQNVRCWVSQGITIKPPGRNPFSVN